MFTLGCHLSSSAGYLAMAETAVSIGANTFQFFTRNPRGGACKPIDPNDILAFKNYCVDHGIEKILAHAPYTLNACSADPKIRNFAKNTMADDLKRMEYTPGNFYNFHPGSHVKQGIELGIQYILEMLNEILTPELSTTVLLETMSGKGSEVGRSFQELKCIIDGTKLNEKLGVCLDTCHIWDAGYNIDTDLDGVIEEFDRVIGLDRLKAIHLNDSKNPKGSAKDRHECIGQGYIGLETLSQVINHPALRHLPFYLETPQPDLDGYKAEIAMLRKIRQEA